MFIVIAPRSSTRQIFELYTLTLKTAGHKKTRQVFAHRVMQTIFVCEEVHSTFLPLKPIISHTSISFDADQSTARRCVKKAKSSWRSLESRSNTDHTPTSTSPSTVLLF